MVTDEKLKKEAYASVSKFCKEFNLTYGVYPTVLYTLNKDKIKTISLKNIEELINTNDYIRNVLRQEKQENMYC